MADNDIYNTKGKYEWFEKNYKTFGLKPIRKRSIC